MDKKKEGYLMSSNQVFRTVRGYQLMNKQNKLLSSAMEDYLEMIYRNAKKEGYMRINMLSEKLHVKPPSATKMVQKLAHLGFLKYEKYGIIFLTERGETAGKYLLKRHNIVELFLENIGVSENLLVETELMEHNIGTSTLACFEMLNSFFENNIDIKQQFEQFKSKYHEKK